jgi:hypothetical protein
MLLKLLVPAEILALEARLSYAIVMNSASS